MRDQISVTEEQVRAKMHSAKTRLALEMEKAITADSEASYNEALHDMEKAINDYNVWKKVLDALEVL